MISVGCALHSLSKALASVGGRPRHVCGGSLSAHRAPCLRPCRGWPLHCVRDHRSDALPRLASRIFRSGVLAFGQRRAMHPQFVMETRRRDRCGAGQQVLGGYCGAFRFQFVPPRAAARQLLCELGEVWAERMGLRGRTASVAEGPESQPRCIAATLGNTGRGCLPAPPLKMQFYAYQG